MLGNFTYENPTKVFFGRGAVENLKEELTRYGKRVMLVYGGGSVKKNGIYDAVREQLAAAGKEVAEIAGIMPNPTIQKLREGITLARAHRADFILAVGGGSCIDYAKALAMSIHEEEDPWEKYFVRFEEPACEVVPVGCVLTMVGTGSEMNAGSVISDPEKKEKRGKAFADARLFPRFAIMDPAYTMTLPRYQMVSGIYDMFNHICEQYFSGIDDNTSDYLAEGLLRSVLHASRIAVRTPQDYEARSNLMWDATWALNTLIAKGKTTDWMVHMLGQAVGGVTNAAHGMTLAAVSPAYYRHILPYGLPKFKRFAEAVWDVDPTGKSDRKIAEEGLQAMETWMDELGLAKNLTELGATEDMIPDMVRGTLILDGGYKVLDAKEIAEIFRESL